MNRIALLLTLSFLVPSCLSPSASSGSPCNEILPDGRRIVLADGETHCEDGTFYDCDDGTLSIGADPSCPGGDADSDSDSDSDTDSDSDSDGDGYNTEDPVEATPVEEGTLEDERVSSGESRYYRLDLPQGVHAMFEVLFRHVNGDVDLALHDHELRELQRAESGTDDERISAWNPFRNETFYLEVSLYAGEEQTFDLRVVETPLDASTPLCGGAHCAELRQLPAPVSDEQGFFPDERAQYHFMRHQLLQAFLYATRQVTLEVPDTTPLGVTQVGDAQGRIPGIKEGDQWHPDGTHTAGRDMDTAYYRTDGPNEGGYICEDRICEVSDEDGCYPAGGGRTVDYFCDSTSDHWVDVERMALYYGHLFESRIIRVIGADRIVVQDILEEAAALVDEGRMDRASYDMMSRGLECRGSYDSCWRAFWAFHVHHTHISTL